MTSRSFGGNSPGVLSVLCVVALAGVVMACAATRQTRSVDRSGFLRDYSQLRPGTGDEAQLVYINPRADFSRYEAVKIDSVTLWRSSRTEDLSPEDEERITAYAYAALHKQLGKDYVIVSAPGPGVLRVRAAVTEAQGAKVVSNAVTTVVPQFRMLSTLAGIATDTQAFVGKAGIEAEITDSLTGEQLAAAVDARAGAKTLKGLGKWSDVESAFDAWAERLRERLASLRNR